MSENGYSIVISTMERPAELARALDSVVSQERRPAAVIVVDASGDGATRAVVDSFEEKLPMIYAEAEAPSAAGQRNQGGGLVGTELVAFIDDDVVLRPDTLSLLCRVFDRDEGNEVGGVAGRIEDMEHPRPGRLLWWYYRIQAGFPDPTYGARLFGPAINCLPCYENGSGKLIRADWLNSTCVVYRTGLFNRERFPAFEGYSFMEDDHLSARVGRSHRLYFHPGAVYEHLSASSEFKRNAHELARMRLRHRRCVSRDVLGASGVGFELKFFLHRVFSSISILRHGGKSRWRELWGTWT
jgi:GT2 family glycosyltransferase